MLHRTVFVGLCVAAFGACQGDAECQSDADCVEGSYCDTNLGVCFTTTATDDGGTTTTGTSNGEACAASSECSSGHCVDGVCCNAACDGQCEACDVAGSEGTCAAVTGAPRGGRAACTGTDSACGGTCDGTNRSTCTYPTVECRPAGCTDGVAHPAATCSEGVCPPVEIGTVCADTMNTKYCGQTSCVGVLQVAAGYDFTCALMSDRTVSCWGANSGGQLGQGLKEDGTPDTDERKRPTRVKELRDVAKLSAAVSYGGHVCALKTDKTASCWGGNFGGPLSLGSQDTDPHPTPAPLMRNSSTVFQNINDLSTGQFFTCLVDSTNTAWCVGFNSSGQLGDGSSGAAANRVYPVQAGMAGEFGHIWSGYDHSCATVGYGASTSVKCWGANGARGVGVDAMSIVTAPTPAAGFTINASRSQPIATGGNGVSCGIAPNSVLNCWGYNSRGQLGRGTSGAATHLAAPVCKKNVPNCSAVGDVLNLTTSFGIGEYAACAVSDGKVHCWGTNNHGQLGDGSTDNRFYARQVNLPGVATQVAVGAFHSCAVLADRSIRCWGWNDDGQLGLDLDVSDLLQPVEPKF